MSFAGMDVESDSPRTPRTPSSSGRLSSKMRGQYSGYHMSGLGQGEASLESLGQGMGDFSQSALSSELSSTVIETDNPFTDASGSPLQSREQQYHEFSGSPLRHTGNPNQNTAFSDEPKGMPMPSGNAEGWKLPRCLSRSSSQLAAESSPLRWSFSNVDRRSIDPSLALSLGRGLLSLPRGKSESAVCFNGGFETPPDSGRSTPGQHLAASAPILCPPGHSPHALGSPSAASGPISSSMGAGPALSRSHRVISKEHLRRLSASESGILDPYIT